MPHATGKKKPRNINIIRKETFGEHFFLKSYHSGSADSPFFPQCNPYLCNLIDAPKYCFSKYVVPTNYLSGIERGIHVAMMKKDNACAQGGQG